MQRVLGDVASDAPVSTPPFESQLDGRRISWREALVVGCYVTEDQDLDPEQRINIAELIANTTCVCVQTSKSEIASTARYCSGAEWHCLRCEVLMLFSC